MKKKLFLSLMSLSILLLISVLISCGSSPPSSTPAQTSPPPEPTLIKEWTGSGIKTTENFDISVQPWAIAWSNTPIIMGGQSVGILQIMVYDINNPNFPITFAANTTEKSSDYSYIYQTGNFYLTINAANTQWTVQVWASQ